MSEANQTTPIPDGAEGEARDGDVRPSFRRRQWIIDPMFQGRYVLVLLIVSIFVGVTAALWAGYFLLMEPADTLPGDETWGRILLPMALGTSLLTLVVILATGVFISHRVAGPAYRLRKSAAQVADGDLDFRIHLRRHDHLKSTAEAFNQMIEGLERRREATHSRQDEARRRIDEALDKLRSSEQSEFPEALRILEEANALLAGTDK